MVESRPDIERLIREGIAQRRAGRTHEAIATLVRATQVQPNLAAAHAELASALAEQGRIEEADAVYRNARALAPESAELDSKVLNHSNYLWPVRPQVMFHEHVMWGRRHAMKLAADVRAHDNNRDPARRLRVGYALGPRRMWDATAPLLKAHDREAVEVFCYSDDGEPREGCADEWRDTSGLGDAQWVQRVRDDAIDVLVDLAGHAGPNRLLAFARRAAPVQVSYLGYLNTTGVDEVDYRLTDEWADSPGATEKWHTEKLARVGRGFIAYQPDAAAPGIAGLPARINGFVTFGSFNHPVQLSNATLRAWGRILKDLVRSRLMLKFRSLGDEGTRAILRERMARQGVPVDRVDMIGGERGTDLREYAKVDIALDPFPCNGLISTCEALWMGAPVVTLAGQVHAGRVGTSILNSAGLPEFIASDDENYVSIVVGLARDVKKLHHLRQGLREKLASSPLLDAPGLARAVEAAYRAMWREWCERNS